MIEAELGVPVTSVFRGIEPSTSPIAAASLGQVYRVQLAEEDQVVAVKVQVRSLKLPTPNKNFKKTSRNTVDSSNDPPSET